MELCDINLKGIVYLYSFVLNLVLLLLSLLLLLLFIYFFVKKYC